VNSSLKEQRRGALSVGVSKLVSIIWRDSLPGSEIRQLRCRVELAEERLTRWSLIVPNHRTQSYFLSSGKHTARRMLPAGAHLLAFLAAAQRFLCAAAILSRASGLSFRFAFFLTAIPALDARFGSAILPFRASTFRTSRNLAISLSIAAMMD
jgi:hypothetical protein